MRVTVVDSEREVHALHEQIVESFDEANRCSPHQPAYPPLEVLEKVLDPEVEIWTLYAVDDGSRPLLAALVENTIGRISWLCHLVPVEQAVHRGAFAALCARVREDCGACWGHVENPAVREALARDAGTTVEGVRVSWSA